MKTNWLAPRSLILLILASASLIGFALVEYYFIFRQSPLTDANRAVNTRFEHNELIVRSVAPGVSQASGLQVKDRIVAVIDARGNTYPMRGSKGRFDAYNNVRYGEPWQLVVARKDADGRDVLTRLSIPPLSRPPRMWFGPLVANVNVIAFSLLCIFTALFVGLRRANDDNAFMAALLFLSVSGLTWRGGPGLFPPVFREIFVGIWTVFFSFATALFLFFFLRFPSPSPIERKAPWIKWVALATAAVFSVWNCAWHLVQLSSLETFASTFGRIRWLDVLQDVIYVAWFLLGLASLGCNLQEARTPDERRRALLLLGGSAGLLPWITVYLLAVTVGLPGLPSWVGYVNILLLLAFPICFGLAVVMYRIFGVRVILRKGLQYALLSKGFLFAEGIVLFMIFYYAAIPIMGGALGQVEPAALALGTAGLTFLTTLGIRQVNNWFMQRIERRFFREAYNVRAIFTDLARTVRRMAGEPDDLLRTVTSSILKAFHPDQTSVFLRGAELRRLASDNFLHKQLLKQVTPDTLGDFYCKCHAKGGENASVLLSNDLCLTTRLPGDSLLAARLEAMVGGDLETVDLYPGNPHAWAGEFSGSRLEEKDFVEAWNVRLLVPLASHGRLLGFLTLGEKLSEEPYSREDKELILAVAQQMADSLDYADLVREGREQAVLRREVQIARDVQEKLLPQRPFPVPNLDYAAICKPARLVGGDYYDFIRRGDGQVGIALGDISGKGVSAALLMAGLQATLRIHADFHGDRLDRMLTEINRHMCETTDEGRFATLFYGVYDAHTRTLHYVNAGHCPPMIIRPGGGDIVRLQPTGPVLGVWAVESYDLRTQALKPGDVLVVFSDGVSEAMSEPEEFFGEERLAEAVQSNLHLSAAEIRDSVLEAVRNFAGETPQNDDLTLVIAKALG